MQFWKIPQGWLAKLESHIWKVRRSLASLQMEGELNPWIKKGFTLAQPCDFFSFSCKSCNCQIKCANWTTWGGSNSWRCWSLWGSMWRWSLAYRKMPPYVACLMFRVVKIHQTFFCYNNNYQNQLLLVSLPQFTHGCGLSYFLHP